MNDDLQDEGEILMGRWDCGACGQRSVMGDAYECSGCGAPRPEDVTFYLPDDAEVVTDAAGIASAEAGPDWQCAFCDSSMPATDTACNNCGASFADSERRQKTGEVAAGTPGRSSGKVPVGGKVPVAGRVRTTLASRERRPMGCLLPWKPVAAVAAVFFSLFCGYGMYLSHRRAEHDGLIAAQKAVVDRERAPLQAALGRLAAAESGVRAAKEALVRARVAVTQAKGDVSTTEQRLDAYQHRARPVTVTGHTWRVEIAVEECTAQTHQGWDHPAHAFDVRSEQKVHHTQRVVDRVETRYRDERYRTQDGYDSESYTERVKTGTRKVKVGTTTKNLGNGRFKRVPKYRNEPVYKTVRKTRKVPRMVWKTRKVPYKEKVYRDDPVYKSWHTYKTWLWRPAGTLERTGTGRTVIDPEGTPPAKNPEALGARRTAGRTVSLGLLLRPQGGKESTQSVQRERWDAFAPGDAALLVVNRLLTPDEHSAAITRLQDELRADHARVTQLEAKVSPLEAAVPPLEATVPPLREALRPLQQRVNEALARLKELEAARP